MKILYIKLNGDHLANLGSNHPEIAERIINNPIFLNKLNGYNLSALGRHLCVARRIIEMSSLYKKLDRFDLENLATNHAQIAEQILTIPALSNKLDAANIARVGCRYPHIAKRILSEPQLREDVYTSRLRHFANMNAIVSEVASCAKRLSENVSDISMPRYKKNRNVRA
jgi:hypothetical protein